MVFSSLVADAIALAVATHWRDEHQLRKGKDVPYLVHPLTVALILAKAGASDEVIAAGILHDTVEDSHPAHKVTLQELGRRFGDEIAALVESVTELDKSLPWEDRKAVAIQHVDGFSPASLLLKTADVVANDRELIADYEAAGRGVFARFNSDPQTLLEYKCRLNAALRAHPSGNPLLADLEEIDGRIQAILADLSAEF